MSRTVTVWVVSTCIPEAGELPLRPNVFGTEAEAEAYAKDMVRAEWENYGLSGEDDEPLPFPDDWRTANQRLIEHFDGLWGSWELTKHIVVLP